jgi:HPt (histidine-containing phosphotransfer) domain-containing protein
MLIYNYKKEFLGIDEADLEALGLNNLEELRSESADFADLFVKTPGHIHNFKHVHWIDYVTNKDGAEAKVIIHIKNKNYAAHIIINTAYLVDNPSAKAFSIALSNIRALSAAQSEKIINDINEQSAPIPASGATELFTTPGSIKHDDNSSNEQETAYDPYESNTSSPSSSVVDDIYESEIEIEDLTADDAPLDVALEEMAYTEPANETTQEVVQNIASTESQQDAVIIEEGEFADYIYNPKIASEELGLPIDLIEEFIQDFIIQAKSFENDLYEFAKNEEFDNLKIQSHKLKGVAANLRIEDVLDAITIVNTASDYDEIKLNLDRFFAMIDRLSGNAGASLAQDVLETKVEDDEDDELILSFKDDVETSESIADSDVPDSITIPELADDDFIADDTSNEAVTEEDLSILDSDEEIDASAQDDAMDIAFTYDKDLIANDIGLDIESFNELFNDYIKEANELSETIIQSADNNDITICKSLAIKLKGMSENMRIYKLDSELNEIINTTSTDKIKEAVESIISKLAQISNLED